MYFEGEPQLECIALPTALDTLIASVVRHVVELVLLEEVRRTTAVGCVQQALETHHTSVVVLTTYMKN